MRFGLLCLLPCGQSQVMNFGGGLALAWLLLWYLVFFKLFSKSKTNLWMPRHRHNVIVQTRTHDTHLNYKLKLFPRLLLKDLFASVVCTIGQCARADKAKQQTLLSLHHARAGIPVSLKVMCQVCIAKSSLFQSHIATR